MAEDILQFQAGREARMDAKPRDGRRTADWLEGWDMAHADICRWDEIRAAKWDRVEE